MEISAHQKIRDTDPLYRYTKYNTFLLLLKKVPKCLSWNDFFAIETAGQGIAYWDLF